MNMAVIICPNCGKQFTIDEAQYASLLNQVKNAEFEDELNRRLKDFYERYKAEQELATAKTEQSYQSQLSNKQLELSA